MSDASALRFRWEWLTGTNVTAAELSATWASIQIWVGDTCITLVEDKESGSARRSIFASLYPLAEWAAYNWWLLTANTRPATMLARLQGRSEFFLQAPRSYRERHCIRSAGDGFYWPDLFLLPEGDNSRLIWNGDEGNTTSQPIRYLSSGERFVNSAEVQRTLAGLIESVLTRLAEQGVTGTALEQEWRTVQGADADEAAYCTAAARLGLDPYAEADPYKDGIFEAYSALDSPELFGDFLDSVDPPQMRTALDWFSRTHTEITILNATTGRPVPDVRDERPALDDVRGLPWEVGWRRARVVRQALGCDMTQPLLLDDVVASIDRESDIAGIQAMGGSRTGTSNGLVALTRKQPTAAKRFTLARALWHIAMGEARFFVTSAHSARQKEERAFAAELLAPASGISDRTRGSLVDSLEEEMVEELAAHYRVSPLLVKHQIENQLLDGRYGTT